MTAITDNVGLLRRQTKAFIDMSPTEIQIVRRQKVDDGAGGWTWDDTPTSISLTVKIQPFGSRRSPERQALSGERVVLPDLEIIAEHDADILRGDHFTFRGDKCSVVFVDDTLEYVKKAECVRGIET